LNINRALVCSTLFISREMKQNDRKINDNSACVAKKYTLSPEHVFVHFSRMVSSVKI
jgi:hypothetical protein